MVPNGERVCVKCDYAIVSFQGMQNAIRLKYSQLGKNMNTTPMTSNVESKSASTSALNMESAPLVQPTSLTESSASSKRGTKRSSGETQKYSVGQKVKFYNTELDDMAIGTIVMEIKQNVYRVGSNGKVLVLSAKNLIDNA